MVVKLNNGFIFDAHQPEHRDAWNSFDASVEPGSAALISSKVTMALWDEYSAWQDQSDGAFEKIRAEIVVAGL